MTNGQRVAAVACELADPPGLITEKGINTDYGGWIDDCQRFWGMGRGTKVGAQPWCGMGADKIFRLAKVDDHGVCHPATATICVRGSALPNGGAPRSSLIYPGTIIVKCGVHIEIVVNDRGNGLLDCVGCNTDNRIKRTVRSKSWGQLIEVPDLRDGEVEDLMAYWFEDPRFDPTYYQYAKKEYRENRIKQSFKQQDEAKLIRRVYNPKTDKYGFWLYTGEEWKWGPWVGVKDGPVKDNRDDLMHALSKTKYGSKDGLRARSKVVARATEPNFGPGGGGQESNTDTH